ncbi:MAG: LacI family DNA-binding transcriptional regulator [Chloroflexota bacterium]|nr:MAG: LacI family transcriptional regulator [Chloroflexota bacterium]
MSTSRPDRPSGTVTIVDVAREAGVSYATVSRVLNNKAHVRPEKREAVLRAMTRLGYVVNQQARSLAGGRSYVVGLLVHGLGNSYMGAIVRGIDEALDAAQYDLMLYTTHRRKAKEAAYVAAITRGLTDGLLLVLPRDPASYLALLQQQRFPYVLIDHQGLGDYHHSVGAANYQGAYAATRYLIELGHRRIGFITGALELGCAVDRLAGYRAALAEFGLPDDPALVQEGDFFQPQGFTAANALLNLPEPPTAIFASNDEMAFGVLEAARMRGLRLPEDLSVIGFDDIPQTAHVHPALTTVRQPLEQMGRVAAETLLKLISDPQFVVERIVLPTELVIRESCCAPAAVRQ